MGKRLQIIFAHNSSSKNNGWTEELQKELMAVISKYVDIGHGNLEINVDKKDSLEILKINVSLSQTH